MQYKLHTLFSVSLLAAALSSNGQTVSTFEDVALPGADTTYLETQIPNGDGVYTFQSGNALFYGNLSFGYWGNFNCSNRTDTVQQLPGTAITGGGYDGSSQFGIAFVPTDWAGPDPTATIPVGARLQGAAAGNYVLGAYITNATYAYRYMLAGNKYDNGNFWLKLVVRGYRNNARTADSVIFTLSDYSLAQPVLVNTWQWVDLTTLGKVDSVTFDLISNDTAGGFGINTPAYFAIDNLTTSDSLCPRAQNIAAVSINENSATITWNNGFAGFATNYEVAVDQSPTPAPAGTAQQVSTGSYAASGLTSNTLYYAHVRAACDNGEFSAWDTASFRTLQGTGIFAQQQGSLRISVSPNPASDMLYIHTAVPVNAVVYSIEGRQLIQAQQVGKLDVSALPSGIYILKVTDIAGKQSGTLRFTKQR